MRFDIERRIAVLPTFRLSTAKRCAATGTMVVAGVLAMAAMAWACTLHAGQIWFCDTSSCPSSAKDTVFEQGSFYVAGDTLFSGTKYVIHAGPLPGGNNPAGDLGGMGAGPCSLGALLHAPGETLPKEITTNGGGDLPSTQLDTPPGADPGITYEACAQPISSTTLPDTNDYRARFSNHTVFTIT